MTQRFANFGDIRLPDRFWAKAHPCPMSGCWLWTASLKPKGYGEYHHEGRVSYAHRVAFASLVGAIPDGLQLDHLCRTRCCVNPAHLEPVTSGENYRRSPITISAIRRAIEVCRHGHQFSPENTRLSTKNGRTTRVCRACVHRIYEARRSREAQR